MISASCRNANLIASPDPFLFSMDASREALVQATFKSNPSIPNLDAFLAETGTQAFLVIQNDTVIYERYFMDYQRDSIVTSFSVAKSFDSAMIGIAIQEGYINSVDDPITNYLPELAQRDPRFGEITIRHLLTMSSGLRYNDDRLFLPEDDNLTYVFDDLRHLALTETEVVEAPGRHVRLQQLQSPSSRLDTGTRHRSTGYHLSAGKALDSPWHGIWRIVELGQRAERFRKNGERDQCRAPSISPSWDAYT